MVPFLNMIGTDVACVGVSLASNPKSTSYSSFISSLANSDQNHDLDFGIAQFRHLRGLCKFPWLLANVLDPALGEDVPIANCEKTKILISSNGVKVGVIGLAEREW